ncbi:LuxR C-terminal-related transcriptional regulator [Rhizobiaceae bacterium]|nr:LuxR C-terminal-related transcriptional regulator [Rhizobiaceae bacterium]
MNLQDIQRSYGAEPTGNPHRATLRPCSAVGAALLKSVFLRLPAREDGQPGKLPKVLRAAMQRLGYTVRSIPSGASEGYGAPDVPLMVVELNEGADCAELEEVLDRIDAEYSSRHGCIEPALDKLAPRTRIIATCSTGVRVPHALGKRLDGVMPLQWSDDRLRETILLVTDGLQVRDPDCIEAKPRLDMEALAHCDRSAGPTVALTPREACVTKCLAQGMSSKEIAREIDLSVNTVSVHINAVLRKLHLNNRTQIALWWVRRNGWLTD